MLGLAFRSAKIKRVSTCGVMGVIVYWFGGVIDRVVSFVRQTVSLFA